MAASPGSFLLQILHISNYLGYLMLTCCKFPERVKRKSKVLMLCGSVLAREKHDELRNGQL